MARIKTIATGSTGNCYVLTNNSGKHLILDAGIPLAEIKKGLDFDVGNIEGCIVTHCHHDHSLSVRHLKDMGIKVWLPYLNTEHKRLVAYMGDFEIHSFDVPHNNCACRAFLIKCDDLNILYATDFEYIPYNLASKKINVMLVEMNYQKRIMDQFELDEHLTHTILGHSSDETTTELIIHNQKYLQNVILCHYSKSGNLRKNEALTELKGKLPAYINTEWAVPGETVTLGCPF